MNDNDTNVFKDFIPAGQESGGLTADGYADFIPAPEGQENESTLVVDENGVARDVSGQTDTPSEPTIEFPGEPEPAVEVELPGQPEEVPVEESDDSQTEEVVAEEPVTEEAPVEQPVVEEMSAQEAADLDEPFEPVVDEEEV